MSEKFAKYASIKWEDTKTNRSYFIIPKEELQVGHYYIGQCRNAKIARWDGEKFWYWREKFGSVYTESIYHPEDDDGFDLFIPASWLCDETGDIKIPLKEKYETNKSDQQK